MLPRQPAFRALYALGTLGFFCLFYFYHQRWIHDAEPEAVPETVLEAEKPDTPESSHAPESSVASFAPDASVAPVAPGTPDIPDPPEEFNDLLNDVYNGTFGFEKIFVVGLPSRTDRRDGMVLQAAVSDLSIEFIDGVWGDEVPDKALPNLRGHDRLPDPSIGSWRGHMNAIQEIVRRNLTSALILEDDTDWDIRIRDQLRDFALSSRALIQPLAEMPSAYADPTYPSPPDPLPESPTEIPFDGLPITVAPEVSPYGDNWDLFWLGHCGMQFPPQTVEGPPSGRVIHRDDVTVPQGRYMYTLAPPFMLLDTYPDHTRVVHHVQEGVCSLAYAVTQHGARRMLQEIALKDVTDAFDILLRFFCNGSNGRGRQNCLASQPALFNHHRPAGPDRAQSDIGDHGEGFRDHSESDMIRWSTRLNAGVLMDGRTDFFDGWPDVE